MSRIIARAGIVIAIVAVVGLSSCSSERQDAKPKTAWIDPNKIKRGPIRHETLTAEQSQRIRQLHKTFAEVDGQTVEQWEDDFKRDADPDGNIRVWEDMEVAYVKYCKDKDLDLAAKKEVFKVVLLRSMTHEQEVLRMSKLKILSEAQAKEIMKGYPSAPQPVEVIQGK